MAEIQMVASGNFTSAGTTKSIALRSDFDYFEVENHTQMATTQATGRGVMFRWYNGYADDSAFMISKQDAANTVTYEVVTSGGFTKINQSNETLGAAVTGTAITAANPAVVTSTSHGYQTGDTVRIYGTTGMLQVSGIDFHVTRVNANSYQLTYLDASGFAAPATALTTRKVPNNPIFSPPKLYITNISQAASAVVTFSTTHNLAVGAQIRFNVTSDNGMTEIDGLIGEVTAVNTTTNTATVNINSSGFTAFSFPTSAVAALGYTQAHTVPVGEITTILTEATDNTAQIVMQLAAGVDSPAGSSSDVIYWRAFKSGLVNNEV